MSYHDEEEPLHGPDDLKELNQDPWPAINEEAARENSPYRMTRWQLLLCAVVLVVGLGIAFKYPELRLYIGLPQ